MSPSADDIDALIDRIAGGETDLYLLVVRRYELPLRSYLAGQLYDAAEADDLAQEVFLTAWRDLSSFRRGEDFGAWLRGIARHRLLTHFRTKQRHAGAIERFREEVVRIAQRELESAAGDDTPARIERLLHCISQLPEKLRRVVRAGLDGTRPVTVAEELRTTVAAIYQLHYRANQLLRLCMQGEAQS